MRGIDIARAYYEQFGAPMLHEQFPELLPQLTAGLVGSGSECFGFDDELSHDHDFAPGFCLFIPDTLDSRTEFRLERAYARLPREFMGLSRPLIAQAGRRGVIRTGDFYRTHTGSPTGPADRQAWLSIPDSALAEAVNGEIFAAGDSDFMRIRQALLSMPEDVHLKKLAAHLALMAQGGQYNYTRCLAHGEEGAAQLALYDFVIHTLAASFLLSRRFCPFYKWAFRGLRSLPRLCELADPLTFLLTCENTPALAEAKAGIVADIAALVIAELKEQGITRADCGDLGSHARSVNDAISDPLLRNLHLLAGA